MTDFLDGITLSTGNLVYATLFVVVGFVLLLGSYSLLALLTPGRLGALLLGTETHRPGEGAGTGEVGGGEASYGAALVTAAWLAGHAWIIRTALESNAAYLEVGEDFLYALGAATLFGAFGMVVLAVAFVITDLVTPGRLGSIVVQPGRPQPLAYVTATVLLALSAVITTSIA